MWLFYRMRRTARRNDIETVAVVAGFIPAIHVFFVGCKDVDARDKPGHDELSDFAA
jgi:hypothetical protein